MSKWIIVELEKMLQVSSVEQIRATSPWNIFRNGLFFYCHNSRYYFTSSSFKGHPSRIYDVFHWLQKKILEDSNDMIDLHDYVEYRRDKD